MRVFEILGRFYRRCALIPRWPDVLTQILIISTLVGALLRVPDYLLWSLRDKDLNAAEQEGYWMSDQ